MQQVEDGLAPQTLARELVAFVEPRAAVGRASARPHRSGGGGGGGSVVVVLREPRAQTAALATEAAAQSTARAPRLVDLRDERLVTQRV